MMKMPIVNCLIGVTPGKESTLCIKRASEVAGISERSPGEETGHDYTSVHAGAGYSTG